MKFITISQIGYNHPSQANWNYQIMKVDLIDTAKEYCLSHTTRNTFGGDSRFVKALKDKNIPVILVKGVYTKTGTPKITGISSMQDIESESFISEVIEWYNK
jgi:hypothetical protein